jgi:membrane-associated phospholipid phosphatase
VIESVWVLVGVGTVALAASAMGARRPLEQRVFHAINGLPAWLYWVLWAPMQLGNLVVGTLAGLAVAWWYRDLRIGIAVLAATGLKLLAERIIRARMADALAVRQRPGTSQTDAILRGSDVPSTGASFPSGHVILVAGIAAVVANDLPVELYWLPLALAGSVMLGRVYVGAHNPLDVTAGLGAGLLVGGLLDLFLR